MLKMKIINIGKNKEKWLSEAIDEYLKRLKNLVEIEWIFLKDENKLSKFLEKISYFLFKVSYIVELFKVRSRNLFRNPNW